MVNIAVMGYGVVGSGVVEVIYKNRESILKKCGKIIDVKYILDLKDFPNSPYQEKFVKDFNVILNDDDISVVVEVMGGIEPAFTFVDACLKRGKSVVSSNKELVAAKGAQLLKTARQNNVNFFFEASVGGGIPIIRPLHQCLAANQIYEIAGILNGTTNFILTKMIKEGMSFDSALKLAQELGYAERNPSADVDGHDACRKICILASLAFGSHVYPQNVHTEGITAITLEDVAYAEDWGGVIKLIGRANKTEDGKLQVMVSPAFIQNDSQLANVNDVFNGILVRGDTTGDVVFYGKGAGKLPTASAVVADVIEEVKSPGTVRSLRWEDSTGNNVEDTATYQAQMYVRAQGQKAKKEIEAIFGEVWYLARQNQPLDEVAFVTPLLKEGELNHQFQQLEAAGVSILAKIRILDY